MKLSCRAWSGAHLTKARPSKPAKAQAAQPPADPKPPPEGGSRRAGERPPGRDGDLRPGNAQGGGGAASGRSRSR